MSRTWIGVLVALLALLGGLLGTGPARADSTVPAVPTVTADHAGGDELTLFHGQASGFTPGATVHVTVTVDGAPYRGAYTTTHAVGADGAFTWAWRWTVGDPYGSYTFSFAEGGGREAGIGLTIENGAAPPAPADGSDLVVDTSTAPPLSTVQAWQQRSPYRAVGVYVPVDAAVDDRHDKQQTNLTQPWVSAVQAGGWHVVPIYVGLQAPEACQIGRFHAMDSDPAKAQAQGVSAAEDAVGAANALGIDANMPVVYDMEAYSAGCSEAVQAFLVGWTARLHALGRPAGVYGTPASAGSDLAAAATGAQDVLPDLFWAATDNRQVSSSVGTVPSLSWTLANQFLLGVPRSYGLDSATEVDESAIDPAAWTLAGRLRPPDTTAPIVAMGNAPAVGRAGRATFEWSGVDAGTGVASYQLRTRRTPGGHRPGAWTRASAMPASTRGATTVLVRPGEQVCAQVRAVDAAGNASDWTLAACTSRLADDRAARPGAGWRRTHAHSAYRQTLTTSTRAHAVLRLGHSDGGAVTVAMTGRGAVVVTVGERRVGLLHGAGIHRLALPRKGTVTLTSSNGRKVGVDGFVLSPR